VPNMWYVLGAILSAGSSLRWLRNLVGLQDAPNAYDILAHEASQVPIGADGLLFLPYLFGERTPLMDAQASGTFVGLRYRHTRAHLARAVMEGVCFALRDAVDISLSLGATVERMVMAGGGGESPLWRQMLTDVLGMPLQKSRQSEQACMGAVILAGVGAGVYSDIISTAQAMTHYDEATIPNPTHHAVYSTRYAQYRALYPLLKDTMHELNGG
jgi:xylulokinase